MSVLEAQAEESKDFEPQGKRRRTKHIKSLNLTADGRWEEEEESVECSDEEEAIVSFTATTETAAAVGTLNTLGSNGPSTKEETARGTVDDCRLQSEILPVADVIGSAFLGLNVWANTTLATQSQLVNSKQEEESDDELVPWGWMKKARKIAAVVLPVLAVLQTPVVIRKVGTGAAPEVRLVHPKGGAPVVEEVGTRAAQEIDEVAEKEGEGESVASHVQMAIEDAVQEQCPVATVEDTSENSLSEYVPGSMLTMLLRHVESSDSESENEGRISNCRSKSRSRSRSCSSDRGDGPEPRGSAAIDGLGETCKKPEAATVDCHGCDRKDRKGYGFVPRMRGSINLCVPAKLANPFVAFEETMPDAAISPLLCFDANPELKQEGSGSVCTPMGRALMNIQAEASPEERLAIQVLSRHVVRLGVSGPGLEMAVLAAYRKASDDRHGWRRWEFLSRLSGVRAYLDEKCRVQQIYAKHGRDLRRSDEEVQKSLPVVMPVLARKDEIVNKKARLVSEGMVDLYVPEIRFAHDSQREHFGSLASRKCCKVHRGVLQLAVELLAGVTQASAVPTFRVCHHNGQWFCYSGNRRLAALRLVQRFAPERFSRVIVPLAPVDAAFLRGTEMYQKKFTTDRNGADCLGRWLIFCETGEAVGRALYGFNEYGRDLLSLLPPLRVPGPAQVGPCSSFGAVRIEAEAHPLGRTDQQVLAAGAA